MNPRVRVVAKWRYVTGGTVLRISLSTLVWLSFGRNVRADSFHDHAVVSSAPEFGPGKVLRVPQGDRPSSPIIPSVVEDVGVLAGAASTGSNEDPRRIRELLESHRAAGTLGVLLEMLKARYGIDIISRVVAPDVRATREACSVYKCNGVREIVERNLRQGTLAGFRKELEQHGLSWERIMTPGFEEDARRIEASLQSWRSNYGALPVLEFHRLAGTFEDFSAYYEHTRHGQRLEAEISSQYESRLPQFLSWIVSYVPFVGRMFAEDTYGLARTKALFDAKGTTESTYAKSRALCIAQYISELRSSGVRACVDEAYPSMWAAIATLLEHDYPNLLARIPRLARTFDEADAHLHNVSQISDQLRRLRNGSSNVPSKSLHHSHHDHDL